MFLRLATPRRTDKMNPNIPQQLSNLINTSIQTGQATPAELIALLEMMKLDLYMVLRTAAQNAPTNIIPVRGNIKPNG